MIFIQHKKFLFRETDWLYSSNEGRRELAASAKFQRLVVIHLGRDHQFPNLECIQNELGPVVSSLQPSDLPPNTQVKLSYEKPKKNQIKLTCKILFYLDSIFIPGL